MSILVSDLSFSYPEHEVLRGISFDIEPGEFVGIIGPNGGGKTTLLHLLMGFLKPDQGKILFNHLSPKKRRKEMGYVPQNFQYDRLFPISVIDVVLTGRLAFSSLFWDYSRKDKIMAHEVLEKVGMKEYVHSPFSSLSSGQAQRVLLARALITNPSYLFLDEAVANIDMETQEEIYRFLKELKGKITILMVTHDLKEALNHVDRMLLVHGNLSSLSREEVCEHFSIGLYHPPLSPLKFGDIK